MSTTIVDNTVAAVINRADPNTQHDAFRKLALATLLTALVTDQSDTGTVPGSSPFTFDLDALPVPGTLRVASGTGALAEYVGASAVAAGQFKTSTTDGVMTVTVHSGQTGATWVAKYSTLDDIGPGLDTPLATILAADFEGSLGV